MTMDRPEEEWNAGFGLAVMMADMRIQTLPPRQKWPKRTPKRVDPLGLL